MNTDRAAKIAAKRIGMAVEEYLWRRRIGDKWCYACKTWHPIAAFSLAKSRRDGRNNICREKAREYYTTRQGYVKDIARRDQIVAKRLGISVEIYQARLTSGQKWCAACKSFHPVSYFKESSGICRHAYNKRYAASARTTTYQTGQPGQQPTLDREAARRFATIGLPRMKIARELGCSYWAVTRALTIQKRSAYSYSRARWRLKRDSPIVSLDHMGDIVAAENSDPFDSLLAKDIRSLLGGIELEDVAALSEDDLEWLQFKLLESGLVSIKVTAADRKDSRPQRADRHSRRQHWHSATEALGGIDDLDADEALILMDSEKYREAHNLEPFYEIRRLARTSERLRRAASRKEKH